MGKKAACAIKVTDSSRRLILLQPFESTTFYPSMKQSVPCMGAGRSYHIILSFLKQVQGSLIKRAYECKIPYYQKQLLKRLVLFYMMLHRIYITCVV